MDRNLARQRVLATIDSIPAGHTASYGEVAAEAGLPGRARFVARVLRELPAGSGIPWYRVIAAGGRLAKHSGAAEQRRALRAEGVRFAGRSHRLLKTKDAAPRARAREAAKKRMPRR